MQDHLPEAVQLHPVNYTHVVHVLHWEGQYRYAAHAGLSGQPAPGSGFSNAKCCMHLGQCRVTAPVCLWEGRGVGDGGFLSTMLKHCTFIMACHFGGVHYADCCMGLQHMAACR